MTETRIYILLDKWKSFQSTKPQDRGDTFEQDRLNLIENIVRTFVDYYNVNYKYSASHRLKVDKDKPQEEVEKEVNKMETNSGVHFKTAEHSIPTGGTVGSIISSPCNALKILVIDVLKQKDWTINDVKFSDKGNLESINIKFASEFALGNSPWDPR